MKFELLMEGPYAQQVIYRYLDCGNLHNGFARMKCNNCSHEYFPAVTIKWYCFQAIIIDCSILFFIGVVAGVRDSDFFIILKNQKKIFSSTLPITTHLCKLIFSVDF